MNREQINKALETAHEALSYAALSATNSKDAEYYKDAEKEVFAALSAPKAEAVIAERDHYKNGLQILADTFYKGDQHQDYAKHVLDTVPTSPVPALTDETVERAFREGHQKGRCDGSFLDEDKDWLGSEAAAAIRALGGGEG